MASEIPTERLLLQLQKLTSRLSEIVARDFLPLSEEQLNWKEEAHEWSIGECLSHLNSISKTHLEEISKAISQSPYRSPNTYFEQNWLGKRLVARVRLNQNNQIKKPRQSPSQYAPVFHATNIVQTFLDNQKQILQFLKSAQQIDIQKTKIPIAFGGLIKIPLGDVLQMIVYHHERHLVQAQRVRYTDGFPEQLPALHS